MKKSYCLFIALTCQVLAAMFTQAFAAGNLPWTKNRQLVPNITSISPATDDTTGVTKGRCDTVTGTKEIFKTYTTAGYVRNDFEVVDASGSPVAVKWLLDGTQVAIGSTFSFANPGGAAYQNAAYKPYSTVSRALTSCRRPQ